MTFELILDHIKSNKDIIALVIPLLTSAAGLFIQKILKKGKQIAFTVKSLKFSEQFLNKVAGNLIEKNHLRYSSSYISNVGIWNRKTDRLEPSDITGDKILISCDGKIYDAYILFESNKLNKFSIQVSEDRRQVELDFSYIEKNDTIIISIIHDSWSSIFSEKKITVSAPVKSAGNSKKVTYNEKSIDMDSNVFGFSKIFAFVYAAGAIYFLILTLTVEGIIWRGLSLLMLFLFIRWLIESVSELRGLPFGNREFKNNI